MLDFHSFEARQQEQLRDMERAVRRERLARRVESRGTPFDLRCWATSRVDYLSELARHWASRIRGTLPAGQPGPVLSDCG